MRGRRGRLPRTWSHPKGCATELKAEELKLTAQVVDLELKRDRLQTDSLYIEKVARKNFQLKRPGETVIEF